LGKTREFYERQVRQLEEKNKLLAKEFGELQSAYEHLEYDLKNAHEGESKEKDHQIHNCELKLANMKRIADESEAMLVRLHDTIKKLTQEKEFLSGQLSALQVSNEESFSKKSEEL
jgi:chromosome segregation ATPase